MASTTSWRVPVFLVAGLLLAAGCNRSSPTEPGPQGSPQPLPFDFRLDGTASSTESDGSTVSCVLDLAFELERPPLSSPGILEYRGTHGGSIQRTVLDATGAGISLWPDVHGKVVVRSIAPSTVEITIPLNATGEGRFWREISRFEGVLAPDGTATGGWNCAPFDIDQGGYVDTRFTARGSWTLSPIG